MACEVFIGKQAIRDASHASPLQSVRFFDWATVKWEATEFQSGILSRFVVTGVLPRKTSLSEPAACAGLVLSLANGS